MTDVRLDPSAAGPPFPRIHEGRYEVDPWATGLHPDVPPGLVAAAHETGLRLLRIGVGCWLPSQDPDPSNHADREWFTGRTLADTADDACYRWTHLDRNLAVCRQLGVDVLLCFDYMPATLARPGPPKQLPEPLRPFAPAGYEFPDGVREAPPADPAVFAAACVRALRHVEEQGVRVRYVELWNEPDLPFFYAGSYAEFFQMYAAFATAVHETGHLVGGPSWAGVLEREEWLEQFPRDCRRLSVPLDFYSFHRYDTEVEKVVARCREVRRALDDAGLQDTQAVLSEWGYDLREAEYFGTVGRAAFTASVLMQLPTAGVTAQTEVLLVDPVRDVTRGRFHGLTRHDGARNPVARCLQAFEALQATPQRITTSYDDVLLAGVDAAGERMTVLIANASRTEGLSFRLDVPGATGCDVHRLDQRGFDETGDWTPDPTSYVAGRPELQVEPESLALLRIRLG